MKLNDSTRRRVRVGALLLLVVATGASLLSLAGTAKAYTVCHWSHEDTIVDPSTNKACGLYNDCTKEQTGCHGNGYLYYPRRITCPIGCCVVGCGL